MTTRAADFGIVLDDVAITHLSFGTEVGPGATHVTSTQGGACVTKDSPVHAFGTRVMLGAILWHLLMSRPRGLAAVASACMRLLATALPVARMVSRWGSAHPHTQFQHALEGCFRGERGIVEASTDEALTKR